MQNLPDINLPLETRAIMAFLTMRCNLDCSYCLNASSLEDFNRKSYPEISGEQWVKGLNRIQIQSEIPVTFTGGEPFLHPDFIYIINNIKSEINIDFITNLQWGKKSLERFMQNVRPERLSRNASYPSIRVSYHPEQMGPVDSLLENVKKLQDEGYNIGIESVMWPTNDQLTKIARMVINCRNAGVRFRPKAPVGKFKVIDSEGRDFSVIYGDFPYPNSSFQEKTGECLCRMPELLIGPNGNTYRCHHFLYSQKEPTGNILDSHFKYDASFKSCDEYGKCEPCDVKDRSGNMAEGPSGKISTEIKDIKF